ncbi:hypothetical protein [Clostridium beijerinckii]|uniref:hypothetical protein n=1 Tax=Clostridium beijerinckii TaxID=1520 RepID=UPI00156F6894|nr:hypothetical protein [Clostridium beijerinckii]NRU73334.1 hypothetical protein [Clostridium beijerinckii]NRW00010.1 hypothetical protein [Clostridium beijerinckii]NRX90086.1 hypothetical protein [Clostridium beijerinckii]NSA01456.1 hypothetical protein [Clostridium beijerinckii]NSB10742.1 hypothetical protein [Clostridium beijerinckii]
MNKIKSSFSKIKASEEFKDKLKMELLNNTSQLGKKATINYYPFGLKVAAVLLIFLGTASFKLIINNTYKPENIDAGNTTYVSKDEVDKFTNDNSISSPVSNKNDNHAIDNSKSNVKTQNSAGIKNSSNSHDNSPSTNNKYNNNNNNNSNNKVKYSKETPSGNSNTNENIASVSQNSDNNNLTPSNDINSSQHATTSTTTNNNSNKNGALSINSTLRSFSSNAVYIPKFQIPNIQEKTKLAKMLPLIIYNGNVYLKSPISIDSKSSKNILGRKIGTTLGALNEINPVNTYSKNIVSNIGPTDVYAVNGYDEDFRIMTNITLADGTNHPEIYECLNGITITTGNDFFGKLNLPGNIANARIQTQTFSESNNEKENFYSTSDANFLNSFVRELDNSTPYLLENIENPLDDYKNNDKCKKIFLDLKDGSKNIPFTILRNGYIYYGDYPTIYFKIGTNFTNEIWDESPIINAN